MDNLKFQILAEIEKHADCFNKVNGIQYRIRCPICGDSQKSVKDSHCYIKCSEYDNEPLLYYCFLCESFGRVDQAFLSKLGINNDFLNSQLKNQRYTKIGSIKKINISLVTGTPNLSYPQVKYIEDRLGKGFEFDDYDRFKIIWDMNGIVKLVSDQRVKNTLPSMRDSISFLSDDRSCILVRSFIDDEGRWRKVKIINGEGRSFYTIKTTLDLFTSEPIVVNIAEGIMDILSVYKNFTDTDNSVYIAALGSDYIAALDYAIMKGFVGNNIIVRIYIDSDIDEKKLRYSLRKYKWLFNHITTFKNIIGKDVGVPINKIKLVERKI